MIGAYSLVVKHNKFQRWVLIIAGVLLGAALIAFIISDGIRFKPTADYSQQTLPQLLQIANTYYSKGDYSKALPYLEEAAKRGSAKAEYSLGYMYQNGEGVSKDLGKAQEYYSSAADKKHTKAKAALKDLDK